MSVKVKKPKENVPASPPPKSEDSKLAERIVQHPLLSLREEVDRLFDDFFSGFSLGPFGRRAFEMEPFRRLESKISTFGGVLPRMDISESDTEFVLTAELPGLDEKDIEVELSDGVLTIEGEKKEKKEEKKKDYHLMERHYGSIRRSYRVPVEVNEDKVSASFDRGVLTVTMPKATPRKKAKKVPIKGS